MDKIENYEAIQILELGEFGQYTIVRYIPTEKEYLLCRSISNKTIDIPDGRHEIAHFFDGTTYCVVADTDFKKDNKQFVLKINKTTKHDTLLADNDGQQIFQQHDQDINEIITNDIKIPLNSIVQVLSEDIFENSKPQTQKILRKANTKSK